MTADKANKPSRAVTTSAEASAPAGPLAAEARWQRLGTLPGLLLWTAPANGQAEHLPSWYAFTGQNQGAPQGQEWLDAVHPEGRSQVATAWASAQTSPGPFVQ